MRREFSAEDIRVGDEYEQARVDQRRTIAERQRHRRITLGGVLSLVFEDPDTVRTALEEMLRVERTTDPDRIESAAGSFNALLATDAGLTATLYIDVADPAKLAQAIADLAGVQRCVYLDIGGERVDGIADDPGADAEPAAAWQVAFPLLDAHRVAWRSDAEIAVGVDHPACSARVVLGEDERRAIGADL